MTANEAREVKQESKKAILDKKRKEVQLRYSHIWPLIKSAAKRGKKSITFNATPKSAYHDSDFVPSMKLMGYGVMLKHNDCGDEVWTLLW